MQMTPLRQARVWSDALSRPFGMYPETDMLAHHSTWELQQACACSSECPSPGLAQGPAQPFGSVELPSLVKLSGGQAWRRVSGGELHPSPPPPFHSLTSPEATARVLEAVTQTLTQYPFDFRGARILSGQDEGVFGWVTANYLLENFIKVGPAASPKDLVPCWSCSPTV